MRLVENRSGIRKTLLSYGAALGLILLIESCASTSTTVVLLPEKDGRETSVSVGEGAGAVVLDKPLAAAASDTSGAVRRIDMTLEEVNKMFADALAAQPPEPIKYTLYFISGGTDLTPDSQPHIETIINEVAKRQAVEVEITGHTDRVGSVADNDRLSLQRAEAVLKILLQRGMKAGSFKHVVGRGEREPLIPTADDVAEPRNRRVEVIVR
jgi:outer membrane protein OmpA-like peptidoglycan-associated protein